MIKKLCVSMILLLASTVPALADEGKDKRIISVNGHGKISAKPNKATVNFAIITREKQAEKAREKNAKDAKEILDAIKKLEIDEDKITMESLSVNEKSEYDKRAQKYEIVGFEARRSFKVEVEDLDTLPNLIAKIVQNGSNQVSNVNYSLKNSDEFENLALAKAVLNAKEKAGVMTSTLGTTLGEVYSMEESYSSKPIGLFRPMLAKTLAAESAAEPEPDAYSEGEIEIEADVHVSFLIGS